MPNIKIFEFLPFSQHDRLPPLQLSEISILVNEAEKCRFNFGRFDETKLESGCRIENRKSQ